MTGRIITVRHGKPALSRETYMTAKGYGQWWGKYDASGLYDGETPPRSLVDIAVNAATVFSSPFPRAFETAVTITGDEARVIKDDMFVEAHLPPPPVPLLKMRPGPWGVVSRVFWMGGYTPEGYESNRDTWKRVDIVADRLVAAAIEGDVMLCAHGYLNWMIHMRLRKNHNWKMVRRDRRNNHWSWRCYEGPEARSLEISKGDE